MGQSKNLLLLLNIKFYIENVLSVPLWWTAYVQTIVTLVPHFIWSRRCCCYAADRRPRETHESRLRVSGLRYEDGPTVSSCSSSLLLHSSLLSEVLALNSSAWWSTIGNETGVIYSVFFYRVVCDSLLAALVSFIFVSLYVSLKSVDMIRFSR